MEIDWHALCCYHLILIRRILLLCRFAKKLLSRRIKSLLHQPRTIDMRQVLARPGEWREPHPAKMRVNRGNSRALSISWNCWLETLSPSDKAGKTTQRRQKRKPRRKNYQFGWRYQINRSQFIKIFLHFPLLVSQLFFCYLQAING